jgi:hypothetical protein
MEGSAALRLKGQEIEELQALLRAAFPPVAFDDLLLYRSTGTATSTPRRTTRSRRRSSGHRGRQRGTVVA